VALVTILDCLTSRYDGIREPEHPGRAFTRTRKPSAVTSVRQSDGYCRSRCRRRLLGDDAAAEWRRVIYAYGIGWPAPSTDSEELNTLRLSAVRRYSALSAVPGRSGYDPYTTLKDPRRWPEGDQVFFEQHLKGNALPSRGARLWILCGPQPAAPRRRSRRADRRCRQSLACARATLGAGLKRSGEDDLHSCDRPGFRARTKAAAPLAASRRDHAGLSPVTGRFAFLSSPTPDRGQARRGRVRFWRRSIPLRCPARVEPYLPERTSAGDRRRRPVKRAYRASGQTDPLDARMEGQFSNIRTLTLGPWNAARICERTGQRAHEDVPVTT